MMSEIFDETNEQIVIAKEQTDNKKQTVLTKESLTTVKEGGATVSVKQIGHIVEVLAPTHLAESWDNVGLMVGQQQTEVTGILTALDVTDEVVDEAIAKGCNLIVSHHPLIFKGLKQVTDDTALGRLVYKLISHKIAVYSAHTNLDIASGGLNDLAAAQIGLGQVTGLEKVHEEGLYKIVVFVPTTHTDAVLNAMGDAGAGHIGNYSHCTFHSEGTGTFLPLEGTHPYIGAVGEITKVAEDRLETIVPKAQLATVLDAMKEAHPYEEVAYEVYRLAEPAQVATIGRLGVLADTLSWEDFVELIKAAFPQGRARFGGAKVAAITNVALCTGSGAEFIKAAAKAGAQAYVTGDVKYHDMQLAKELGILVADVGHFGTEVGASSLLAAHIEMKLREQSITTISVHISETQKDFFFA